MGSGVSKTTVNDRVWRQLMKKLPGIGKVRVKVGIVGSNADKEHGESGLTVADIWIIHELGAPNANIPARAPLRTTFEQKLDELKGMQLKLAKALLNDKMDVQRAFNILGAWGASAIKATIKAGLPPPLAASTIARKGSSVPLIDTGQLINSVTWAVFT